MTFFECLNQLSIYIKAVLKNCEEKEWEALSDNEKQRAYYFQQLQLLKADNSQETIRLLQETIALNKQATVAANNNKQESENSLLTSKRNTKKTAFYQ